MASARSLFVSLRPEQWTKNLVVFAALIFGEKLTDPSADARAVAAFVIFCALSGVVYLTNDVLDGEADGQHPLKSKRPIASGQLSPQEALGFAGVFAVAAAADEFGFHGPLDRRERRLHHVAYASFAGFLGVAEFPGLVEGVQGRGHLQGLRLREVGVAREQHRQMLPHIVGWGGVHQAPLVGQSRNHKGTEYPFQYVFQIQLR